MPRTAGDKRRRVALVLPALNSGGAERAALNVAVHAPRSSCVVVVERVGGNLMSEADRAPVMLASRSESLPSRGRRIARLARALRSLRPDVVVTLLSPVVVTVAARACRVPVMQWLQNPWGRTTNIAGPGMRSSLERRLLLAAVKRSAVVAAATPGLLDDCEALGIDGDKLALLPNGLVLPPMPPRRARTGHEDASHIVTVARLDPQKRHDLLLDAVAELSRTRNVRLTVIGTGQLEQALRERARRLGIAEVVSFLGFVPDPTPYVAEADAFVLSTDYEGFGNVIVEALACGVPAVVSDVPYGPRFIADGSALARLVPPGSAQALAEHLGAVLDAGEPGGEARAAARKRAERFSVERVANRFEELVDVALAGGLAGSTPSLREWA